MYGLIGFPLGHSFSKRYFTNKFAELNLQESYELFPIPSVNELPAIIAGNPDLRGFNVTIPYKQEIIQYLDFIEPEAKEIGAVNTVKINRDDNGNIFLSGYNTDWKGFTDSIKSIPPPGPAKVLILGTGGGAKAVGFAMQRLGFDCHFVSRNKTSCNFAYSDLTAEIIASHMIIINTTPLGMWPHTKSAPTIPYEGITPKHLCIDIVYNPPVTLFLELCATQGATIKNGLAMLHNQAEEAWEIWNK